MRENTVETSARFSPDRVYRYTLVRTWDSGGARVVFIGLNPSTADETRDDPTIRRCIGFARSWGYGSVVVVNLFAFRATEPRVLKRAREPVGPENDAWIRRACDEADLIVAAWGVHGSHLGRGGAVLRYLPAPHCLGVTLAGSPRHPLYLARGTRPVEYAGGAENRVAVRVRSMRVVGTRR